MVSLLQLAVHLMAFMERRDVHYTTTLPTPCFGPRKKPNIAQATKITDWVKPGDKSGEFKRQQSSFRNWISREPGAQFPPEKGRYHLYVSYACPWVSYS
jgi:putative glutathione S-transferase